MTKSSKTPTNMPTPDQIRERHKVLMKNADDNWGPIFGKVEPEYLLGFRNGEPLDFKLYDEVKFPHPKEKDYYKVSEFDEHGMPKKVPVPKNADPSKAPYVSGIDPEFAKIYEGIVTSGKIDDPILVYFYDGKFIVLNGATRLSVISQRRRFDPSFIKKVPIQIFRGTELEARGEMIRTNLEGRVRTLKSRELIASIKAIATNDPDISVNELQKILTGKKDGNYQINHAIIIALKGSQEVIRAYDKMGQEGYEGVFLSKLKDIVQNYDDHAEQNRILKETIGMTREESLVRMNGAAAIPSKLQTIKSGLVKAQEYTVNCGIGEQCAELFEKIQSGIDTLIETIVSIDREAMADRVMTAEEYDQAKANEEEQPISDDEIMDNPHIPYNEDPINDDEEDEGDPIEDGEEEEEDEPLSDTAQTSAPKDPDDLGKKEKKDEDKPVVSNKVARKILSALHKEFDEKTFVCQDIGKILAENHEVPDDMDNIAFGKWVSTNFAKHYIGEDKAVGGFFLRKLPRSRYAVLKT